MSITYAIDPGKHRSGVAVFDHDRLVAVCLVDTLGDPPELPGPPDLVVVEEMVYRRGVGGSIPGDLFSVAFGGGYLAGRLGRIVSLVAPHTWKGGTPKDISHQRIRAALFRRETAVMRAALQETPRAGHGEIMDAIGIGLWAVRRRA